MPNRLKCNAVFVAGLSVFFYWSFMFAKHNPALRDVIPFGNDPYDAVGSFGVIVGLLVALVSLVRAFRPYRRHPPPMTQRVYLVRTQTVVVLAVFITLATDVIAMIRHPSMWVGATARGKLIVLLGSLAIAAAAVQVLIRISKETPAERVFNRWTGSVVTGVLAALILLTYPEHLINATAPHLLTVVLGDLLLFAPMRPLLTALVPADPNRAHTGSMSGSGRFLNAQHRWGVVLLGGALIGAFLALAEMSEGGGALPPLGQLLFVTSVFVSLATAGLLIAYAFLGGPLGLGG